MKIEIKKHYKTTKEYRPHNYSGELDFFDRTCGLWRITQNDQPIFSDFNSKKVALEFSFRLIWQENKKSQRILEEVDDFYTGKITYEDFLLCYNKKLNSLEADSEELFKEFGEKLINDVKSTYECSSTKEDFYNIYFGILG